MPIPVDQKLKLAGSHYHTMKPFKMKIKRKRTKIDKLIVMQCNKFEKIATVCKVSPATIHSAKIYATVTLLSSAFGFWFIVLPRYLKEAKLFK